MKIKTSELIGLPLDWAAECALSGRVVDVNDFVMRSADESYSKHWDQGGPIIEWEKIAVDYDHDVWNASLAALPAYYSGPTPLIAAMRCFVASKLGDEVEVPEELLQ